MSPPERTGVSDLVKASMSLEKGSAMKIGAHTPHGPHGHSIHDLFSPHPVRREFFVNVALMSKDRQLHAAAVAKAHGRTKFGRVGSLLGGAIGSIMANSATFDETIADGVRDLIQKSTVDALKSRRWLASVTAVALPPLPGQKEWPSFVNLDDKGHFMVFRILVTSRLPKEKPKKSDGGFASNLVSGIVDLWEALCSCCEAPIDHEATERRLADEMQTILPEVQKALLKRRNPVVAELSVADAKEEYKTLFELNWSRELCAEAINASRAAVAKKASVA
uniref:Uncharacterized protein n=1 Tax=Zooxanthella nutricula TaxID=1333877 RepID=A0A7S2LVD6_9DINO